MNNALDAFLPREQYVTIIYVVSINEIPYGGYEDMHCCCIAGDWTNICAAGAAVPSHTALRRLLGR